MDRDFRRAERLRNLLAHDQHNIVVGFSWEELFDLVEWLEQFLQTSDRPVETRAAAAASTDLAALWSSA